MPNEETVPDLYQLAFVPGVFRCPQCDFQLSKNCLSVATGTMGTREEDRQSEPCPNDGTMMVHVTYREQLEAYAERLNDEMDVRDAFRERFADYITSLGIATGHGDTANALLDELRGQLSGAIPAGEYRARIECLAMFCRRLYRKLRKHEPEAEVIRQCNTYLRSIGLAGTPLRAEEAEPVQENLGEV